jgi:carbonic anhydrase/acetyltransferase-like protein (isoleucine patch superfamily)
MSIYQLGQRVPVIDPTAFVYESATLIGLVILRARVNVWPYATIRGENEPIEIDENSNVQECCVLHTDPGFPVTVAANVTIGHQAVVHGCTIGEGSLIGIDIAGMHSNTANYVRRGQHYKEALRRIA